MADMFKKYKVKPVIECFNPDMMTMIPQIVREGLVSGPLFIEILFELRDEGRTFQENARQLLDYIKAMPEGAVWSCTRGASTHFNLLAMAASLGGNLRTGLEDYAFAPDGITHFKSNGDFIKTAAEIATRMGRAIATPAQARKILGI